MLFETLEHGSVAEYVMKQAKREKPEPPTPSRFAKRVFTTSVPTNRASCSFALTPSSSESLERQQKYCVQSRYYHKTGLLSCSEHYHPFDFFSGSFFPRAQRAVTCSKISFLPRTSLHLSLWSHTNVPKRLKITGRNATPVPLLATSKTPHSRRQ